MGWAERGREGGGKREWPRRRVAPRRRGPLAVLAPKAKVRCSDPTQRGSRECAQEARVPLFDPAAFRTRPLAVPPLEGSASDPSAFLGGVREGHSRFLPPPPTPVGPRSAAPPLGSPAPATGTRSPRCAGTRAAQAAVTTPRACPSTGGPAVASGIVRATPCSIAGPAGGRAPSGAGRVCTRAGTEEGAAPTARRARRVDPQAAAPSSATGPADPARARP